MRRLIRLEVEMTDGKKLSVAEGSYIYFPSRAPHRAKCVSDTECTFYLTSSDVFDIHLVEPKTWAVSQSWSAATAS